MRLQEALRNTGLGIFLIFTLSRRFVDPAPLGGTADTPAANVHEDSDVEQLQTLKHSIGNTLAAMKAQAAAHAAEVAKTAAAISAAAASEANRTAAVNSPQNTGSLVQADETEVPRESPASVTSAPRPLPPSLVPRGQAEVIHGEHQRQNTPTPPGVSGSVPADSIVPPALQSPGQPTFNGQRRAYTSRDLSNAIERMDKLAAYANAQYSPMDMAEYVFRTGDEKGVTLAVEEFLQQGLMTRDEAIAFLQEVKYNLDYLQAHYIQNKERTSRVQKALENAEMQAQNRAMVKEYQDMMEPLEKRKMEPVNDIQVSNLINKESSQDTPARGGVEVGMGIFPEDADYEELLERLRVADFLYTQYTLEEVIYQLANVMFAQSLARGSAQVQEAIQKFTSFLEAEAAQGRISIPLEKKILDVLIASLSDTLTKHPDLVPTAREGLGGPALQPSGRFLQELLLSRAPARLPNQDPLRNLHETPSQLGLTKYMHRA
ncbi:uncharacterized protein LOC124310398 isoform X1 [Neodiprion virginianus]|uniref:uncharacterized protein LOC124310398 isoform X1 n=2 Tax=Neodiprion virginianus TaxID=2961670 RepID=UPI001EE6C1DE|nr:uncharacterized protein LOC124310398 isoform X1 [Neodiprion virginianus]XP_046630242.1 uncharacterized protein LOC124310398 isoform X1 [Neodiprion virginianus]XP_046630243.1 uncharacterized protein LOC124310398 isoform X1 [Neodiprion virginianus]